jgi:outer membrane protein assembly factor BamB
MKLGALGLSMAATAIAGDQAQWGSAWHRNMVSAETNLAASFDIETNKNIRWRVPLGGETHSSPVVAHGSIYIGTNNDEPRDPRHRGDRGVLLCLNERNGALRWQLVAPKLSEDRYYDWPKMGMSSPATVEKDRIFIVTNRAEVVCLDPQGMGNGNDGPFSEESRHQTPPDEPAVPIGPTDADILWATDLVKEAGIWPHDAAHTSILVRGPHLYLNTGTGVDNTHRRIRTPEAPSLIVLDKATGRILARDDEKIAPLIFHATWSSPSLAVIDGRETIFFCGGNGVLYAFEPLSIDARPSASPALLKKRWSFDPDPTAPKEDVHRFTQNKSESPSTIAGLPVFADGKIYIAGGGDTWWGKNGSWIKCVDASTGMLLWTWDLGNHVMSSPVVAGDLCFIADTDRHFVCLDAKTGRHYWTYEMKGDVWATPLVADDKVYLASRKGDVVVVAAAKDLKILCETHLRHPVSATACAANGVVYFASMTTLFAIAPDSK